MKMADLQTIAPLDYKLAKSLLPGLPKEHASLFDQLIRDHMFFCGHKERFDSFLRYLEGSLFDEAPLQAGDAPAAPAGNSGPVPDDKASGGKPGEVNPVPAPKPRLGRHNPVISTHLKHAIGECSCSLCGEAMVRSRTMASTLILAKPFLTAERNETETRRCLTCDVTTKAEQPPQLAYAIGRYAPSAVASLGALRYLFGMPSLRMETLGAAMGIRVPDSTQWYLFEEAASRLRGFSIHLSQVVANAPVKHFDDTGVLILSLRESIREKQEEALAAGKRVESVRSGLHTTVSCAVLPDKGKIVQFDSGLHHGGEISGKLLAKRTVEDTIVLMADASNANTSRLPTSPAFGIIVANCNSHVVRKFRELAESFPEAAAFFEQAYAQVFRNDAHCRTENLTAEERLAYHAMHSLPLMNGMKERAKSDLEQRLVEPSSGLGKAYAYMLGHFERLTAFCHVENAPVCNNLAERMLKAFIRQRKASLFFRNAIGSAVADILSSLFITAQANGINPVRYVETMLLHPNLLRSDPDAFLPWNFDAKFGPDPSPPPDPKPTTE